jgi:DNA processing protein
LKAQHQLYQIALTFLKGIGPKKASLLISRLSSLDAIFEESIQNIHQRTQIPISILFQMDRNRALELAKEQVEFITKNEIKTHFFMDSSYPRRLKQCNDAPLLVYSKGNFECNPSKVVSIVGTRHATPYGKELTRALVEELKQYNIQIISGLAYGTDYNAHKAALDSQMSTVGVLGHGLDRIYPSTHCELARKMCENNGGLLTEFPINTKPDRINFPMRNRIVAGMSDALIIIESKRKGGSMITAELAFDYNRDVFAFPGSIHQENSSGCNLLIQKNMSHLITNPSDFIKIMDWKKEVISESKEEIPSQPIAMTESENILFTTLKSKGKRHFDQLIVDLHMSSQELNSMLFNLEMEGLIKCFPGRVYSI